MVALIDNAELELIRGERYVSPRVSLARLTDTVRLRIARQTTDNSVVYGRECKLRLRLFVHDGRRTYTVEDTDVGRVVNLRGRQSADTTITYTLPVGFFGRRSGYPERLGQRASNYQAWAEVECLFGSVETTLTLDATESPVPRVPHHSSVAFDTASSVASVAAGTTVTVSHTATGSDKAVFIGGFSDYGTTRATSHSATYAGNAATEIWDAAGQFDQRHSGDYVLDAAIPGGAQNAVLTITGGAGSLNAKGMTVVSMAGVNQSAPVGTPQTDTATSGTTPSVTVTGTTSDGMVVDQLCAWVTGGSDPTAGTDQTRRTLATASSDFKIAASTQLGSSGGAMTWTKTTNNEYALGAVEFRAAAGGATFNRIVPQLMLVGAGT